MSAAAATSQRRRKEEEARRAAVRKKRADRAKRAQQVFEKLSSDGKFLPESQVGNFLVEAIGVKRDKLDPDAVQLVIDTARKRAGDGGQKDHLPKDALLGAVEKYGEYVRNVKNIEQIIHKFDKDKNGAISRDELLNVLREQERKAKRVTHLLITDHDIDFILEQSDADGNGELSPNELLPALAAWEELAAQKMEKQTPACSCTLL